MNKNILLLGCLISSLTYAQLNEKGDEKSEIKLGESIITSATGFATEIRDLTSTPKVVNAEEIQKKQYSSVEEALKDIPGIDILYNSKGKPIVSMRGQGMDGGFTYRATSNVKVMIDGISTDNIDVHDSELSMSGIPMSKVERIEVIPGGGAVLYGSGTSGGIVNIITKNNEERRRGNIGYKIGDTIPGALNISYGESIGKFDMDLSYLSENGDRYIDNEESDIETLIGKIRYKISDSQSVLFKYTNIDDAGRYADHLSQTEYDEDRNQSGLDGENNLYEVKTEEYSITYANRVNNKFEFDIMAYTKDTNLFSHEWDNKGKHSLDEKMTEKDGVKIKSKYSYGDFNSVITGLEYRKDKLFQPTTSVWSGGYDLEQETYSAFILNNLNYNNFNFTQGIRYEKADYDYYRYYINKDGSINTSKIYQFDEEGKEVAYELGANYKYSDTGNTYIKYEHAFLLPPIKTMLSRNVNYTSQKPTQGEWYLSDLNPQTSNTFEIGFKDYIGNSFVSAAVYYTETIDEIYGTPNFDAGPPCISYYNLAKTSKLGFDLTAEQTFGKLTFKESYSYLDAEVKEGKASFSNIDLAGTAIPYVSKHKFSLGAEYQLNEKLLIMGDVVYTGGMYAGNSTSETGVTGESRGKQNEHIITNIKIVCNIDQNFNLYAGINNLFNEEYYTSFWQDGNTAFEYKAAPERNYYIGFDYRF